MKQTKGLFQVLLSYHSHLFHVVTEALQNFAWDDRSKTWVPVSDDFLIPQWTYLTEFKSSDAAMREKQRVYFDKKHHTKELSSIPDDTSIWIGSDKGLVSGQVVSTAQTPSLYNVETPDGQIQRNHIHLRVAPETSSASNDETPTLSRSVESSNCVMTRLQTGTVIRPPSRYT